MTDDELLETYAHPATPTEDDHEPHWWFSSPTYVYVRESALDIIRIHLELGTPVTEILSAHTFALLVARVVALEQRALDMGG